MKPSDAAVEAAALAMFADEHCDKRQMQDVRGNWDSRLDDEDRALYRSMARAALEAAYRVDAPRPLLDREAAEECAANILGLISPTEMRANLRADDIEDEYSDWSNFVRTSAAIMKLARPMPTRKQIEVAVDSVWYSPEHSGRSSLVEAMLALLNGDSDA